MKRSYIIITIILTILVLYTTTQVHAQHRVQPPQPRLEQENLRLQNEWLEQQLREAQAREYARQVYMLCMQHVYPSADDFGQQEFECRRQALQWYVP